jgi:hypothetical protein
MSMIKKYHDKKINPSISYNSIDMMMITQGRAERVQFEYIKKLKYTQLMHAESSVLRHDFNNGG